MTNRESRHVSLKAHGIDALFKYHEHQSEISRGSLTTEFYGYHYHYYYQ